MKKKKKSNSMIYISWIYSSLMGLLLIPRALNIAITDFFKRGISVSTSSSWIPGNLLYCSSKCDTALKRTYKTILFSWSSNLFAKKNQKWIKKKILEIFFHKLYFNGKKIRKKTNKSLRIVIFIIQRSTSDNCKSWRISTKSFNLFWWDWIWSCIMNE